MTNLANAIIRSMATHARKDSDVYPTPPQGTWAIAPYLKSKLKPGAVVAEPACGRGDMAIPLSEMGFDVEASDILDTGFGEPYTDFLKIHPKLDDFEVDAVITNPPFRVAEEFIRHAVIRHKVSFVGMLLKSNYWNTKGRLKLWDECTPTAFFPLTWRLAFLEQERGSSPLMDCTWWFWVAGDPPLPWRPLARPETAYKVKYPRRVLRRDAEQVQEQLRATLEAIHADI